MKLAAGIISGTSMDGIDVAALRTDGHRVEVVVKGATYPYPADLKARLIALVSDPIRIESDALGDIESDVTEAHMHALLSYLRDAGLARTEIDVAGFHGQTILHRPERGLTRQLFDGELAARQLGIDVVCQFRLADVEAGGQGAPLVPLYHKALLDSAGIEGPVAVLNLGGVANVTFVDGDTLLACDTGPASALIDDWVRGCGLGEFDRDGALAASGVVHWDIVDKLMTDPYFSTPPPKSLDRNHFHVWLPSVHRLSPADGAATLTAFTERSIAASLAHLPRVPVRWLVCGGGRRNRAMLNALRKKLGVPVQPVEAIGWDGDSLEAECFAFLAVRSLHGSALSLPSTTGVPRPLSGGRLHQARRPITQ